MTVSWWLFAEVYSTFTDGGKGGARRARTSLAKFTKTDSLTFSDLI